MSCCGSIVSGSSPLARGTLKQSDQDYVATGLIPARAGNTDPGPGMGTPLGAHPRSRGEHGSTKNTHLRHTGSSPLARGTQKQLRAILKMTRLIPARAGNTCEDQPATYGMLAHPRSRGEHSVDAHMFLAVVGSSPLARGTQPQPPLPSSPHGLIPARAGNTFHEVVDTG